MYCYMCITNTQHITTNFFFILYIAIILCNMSDILIWYLTLPRSSMLVISLTIFLNFFKIIPFKMLSFAKFGEFNIVSLCLVEIF